jgi:hypothetical protein
LIGASYATQVVQAMPQGVFSMCMVLSHKTHDETTMFAQNADGFPRTALQVDFLKLLYDKMLELHNKHADGPEEWQYPRPSFKVCFQTTFAFL